MDDIQKSPKKMDWFEREAQKNKEYQEYVEKNILKDSEGELMWYDKIFSPVLFILLYIITIILIVIPNTAPGRLGLIPVKKYRKLKSYSNDFTREISFKRLLLMIFIGFLAFCLLAIIIFVIVWLSS
ncbi:MAG: hypothetical protein QY321_03850 [Patescibacteria group bacterium]|nr:MAG: hypothetical protein QY321_03850 [Patescibacteria group bacterium]